MSQPATTLQHRLSLLFLCSLLLITIANDSNHASYVHDYLNGHRDAVAEPFFVNPGTRTIGWVSEEAEARSISSGDILLLVNGRDYDGMATLYGPLARARPGDLLKVTVQSRLHDTSRRIVIPLKAKRVDALESPYLLITLLLGLPLICQIVGFGIAFLRSYDYRAWILFILSLSSGCLLRLSLENHDGTLASTIWLAYNQWLADTWCVWLVLLGLYFPHPLKSESRARWIKWLLLVPMLLFTVYKVTLNEAVLKSTVLAAKLIPAAKPLGLAFGSLQLFAIVCFFAVIILRYFAESQTDARRRLRLLYVGTSMSIIPLMTVVVFTYIQDRELSAYPTYVVIPCLTLTLVFPLTFAYLLIVHRALDVGVLVRDNLHMLLSKRGSTILRIGVFCAIALLSVSWMSQDALTASNLSIILAIAAAATAIVSPSALRLLRGSIDQIFFRDALSVEHHVRNLVVALKAYRHTTTLLEMAERSLAMAFGARLPATLLATSEGFRMRGGAPADEQDIVLRSDGAIAQYLHDNPEPVVIYLDDPRSWVQQASPSERAQLAKLHSQLLLPLLASNGLVAILTLGPRRFDAPYSKADLAILQTLSHDLSLALENVGLIERISLEVADRERLKAEKDAARTASEAKSSFLANMSHELRTPMNAIIGYSELLIEEAEDAGIQGFKDDLKKIYAAGKHLLEVINSVLDISKIEAGKMDVYEEAFGITGLLEEVIQVIKPLVEKNGNQLALVAEPGLGYMSSDKTKLRQCLLNLTSNASKFTKNGRITIKVSQQNRLGRDWILFAVQDTGIGMTPEQLTRLFKAFEQADSSVGSKYGGTGLGLHITKKFCQMLGGDVTVDSEAGKGTVFTIVLPRNLSEPNESSVERTAAAVVSFTGRPTVLVIDSDPIVHDLLTRSLSKREVSVANAFDGEQGVKLANEIKPQAIILDLMMGGALDGWQVLASLKSDDGLCAIPVVMMTMLDDKKTGFAFGASEYLIKPVGRARLHEVVSRFCIAPGREKECGAVLVVDDDPDSRLVIRRSLELLGWEVKEATSGKQALAMTEASAPVLIVLDLLMPEMDGFTFMEELSKNAHTVSIPVIVVTAKDLTPREQEHLRSHRVHVVDKHGFTSDDLVEQVTREVMKRIPTEGHVA